MTITVAGQIFDAYQCGRCGMRATSIEAIELCEMTHIRMDGELSGKIKLPRGWTMRSARKKKIKIPKVKIPRPPSVASSGLLCHCGKPLYIRGLCRAEYMAAWRLVKAGKATWAELEAAGRVAAPAPAGWRARRDAA